MAAASWAIAPLGGALTPPKRSAHVMCNRYPGSVASPRALLVHGGEAEDGNSCGDLWLLDLDALAAGDPPWRPVATEGSLGPRSNHAALVHNGKLYVFGGVRERLEALSRLEALDLETLRWELLADDSGSCAPPPRWNPTLVLVESASCLVCFGGYDGVRKHNDISCFDLGSQQWVIPETGTAETPPPMTDHAAAVVGESMVVVGGTHTLMAQSGSASEASKPDATAHVWTLQLSQLPASAAWSRLACSGEAPPSCTSHTATALGSLLLVAGGQHCWQMAPLQCHVFKLSTASWSLLGQPAPQLRICRHAAAFADGFLMLFGGHDGEALSDDLRRIPLAGLLHDGNAADATAAADAAEDAAAATAADAAAAAAASTASARGERDGELPPPAAPPAPAAGLTANEMFQVAQKPLRAEDLPRELTDQKGARQLIGLLHREAVSRGLDMYIDPLSGYPAFTKLYLQRRECCGNKCRHCPHGHKNVVKDGGTGRTASRGPALGQGDAVALEW